MCGHGPDFFALIKSSEAFISFNARGEHHRRGDGFYAWYQAVDEEVTGKESAIPVVPQQGLSQALMLSFFIVVYAKKRKNNKT